ncbi:bifunctional sulfate adenylyltransferase/adenylylsulfate kinase [Thermobifida fusca]|jgi:sulfate adenylyltransferase|uniref:Adenylyl-sulfate kinase n=1 Tax=Thermobifida fusca (strain YX) TaxID=269800 RepID=Q47SV4_THEFY|nr:MULTISPECIES: adenylyl-sulfate kinase [Thermobifida]AAZ54463.1 adenylylsulfate kinase [Thermobifida fusca YX]MBO2529675.1 adenylyl-sulfate kinase [Thermobifida sp.]
MTQPTGGRAVFTPGPQGLAHLELLLSGVCPLPGFMAQAEAAELDRPGPPPAGAAWPVPVTLTVPETLADVRELVLADPEGAPLAELTVTESFRDGTVRLAGPIRPAAPPAYGSHRSLRATAADVRSARDERRPLLAVVTDRPLHHRALAQIRAALATLGDADLLVLVDTPLDGEGAATVVLAARPCLPEHTRFAVLTLPTAPADGAPEWSAERRGLLAAHVAAAYGATHLMLEGVGELPGTAAELPVKPVAATEWVYDTVHERWRPADEVPPAQARPEWDTAAVDEALAQGTPLPAWLTPEPVAAALARTRPARTRRGLVLFFTGLSGSGKSTVARGVAEQIRQAGRTVTLLDGDVVRRLLSAGLTFSRADRDLNIRRIGYVAAEIARHGGVAVCAPIAPYAATRAEVRRMAEETGDFFLVYVATPLEVCEARDRKGLYAKARAGEIPAFTGISDPYEPPEDADLVLDTSTESEEESVARVVAALRAGGWLPR